MNVIRIVVTGGPSGGKTTLIQALEKEMRGKVAVVPEAASILYRGGFPRMTTTPGRVAAQRSICLVQRELEELVAQDHPTASAIVCDRGSLDSIAYWPDAAPDFFQSLNTTESVELARYQWVIHLDTADADSFDTTNPVRTESYNQALELNQKIKDAWAHHSQRIIIPHSSEFLGKITKAKQTIDLILAGNSFQKVCTEIYR